MQVVNIFVLSSKVHAESFSRRYICVCIAPMENCVPPGLDEFDVLLEVVLSLVSVRRRICVKVKSECKQ